MSGFLEVSVVMSVYNGASTLPATMDSILSQEDVELEFIVVNDGSTDETGEILEAYARRDSRVRVIHQENTGLTRALIRGCAAASGEFIARQDAGDVSRAGRLATQANVLRTSPNVVMTSCGTQFVGPGSEFLYEVCQFGDELHRGLQCVDFAQVYGPSSHPSVMFRRAAYEKVGGYRAQFAVAQDLDLWMRLAELGRCWGIPEVLCERRLDKNSISGLRRHEQIRSTKLIVKCAAVRRSGRDDVFLVANLKQFMWTSLFWRWLPRRFHEAKFYYFVGSMLRHRQPKQAQRYFWRAVAAWFPYPRAWYRILSSPVRGEPLESQNN